MKSIKLPHTNLYLKGSGYDVNGNKVIKISFPNSRAFSIQTGGNLPETGTILRGLKTPKDIETVSLPDLRTIAIEVSSYIKRYGTDTQKRMLKAK